MTYEDFKKKHQAKKPNEGTRKPIHHDEDQLQMSCVDWFKNEAYPQLAPNLFHVNNEPYLGRGLTKEAKDRIGARYKSMGVTAGVADIILLHPEAAPGTAHALCIEFKNKIGGRQSKEQKEWQQAVEAVGYRYEVIKTAADFQDLVHQYLGIDPRDHDQAAIEAIFGPEFKARIHKNRP